MASEAVQWGCCINKHGIDIEEKSLKCPTCGKYYHCACISLKKPPNDINTWKCPSCKSSTPKAYRNDSTPIRNVSTSRGSKRQATGSPSPPSLPNDINDIHVVIREIIQEEFSGMLVKMNETIISTINQELEPLKKEMQGIRDSISFMNDKFEDIKKEQQSSNESVKKLELENIELKTTIQQISERLVNLEQQSRSNNLEVQCVPENKNENVYNICINTTLTCTARIKAKEMNYKYVWVRNGKIFVRKSEGAELIQIRNKNSLSKII
ncbi:unnamed protein product [Euphydryas editha]|uniref:FP protein C-terminal domain-containing protein n=1 Tax=Euphydryas editha TaxID=104508 RepID=A0AAU9VEF0_EUPED|nr:unnamed protein product [Euphydryas editha]